MTGVGEFLYLIIAIAVVLVALVAGLVSAGVRRGRQRLDRSSGGSGTIAPPREPGIAVEDRAHTTTVEPERAEPVTPTLERPEGTASRLVRLRQRLSRSQAAFGRGLLALLSRERLDEDTWEE